METVKERTHQRTLNALTINDAVVSDENKKISTIFNHIGCAENLEEVKTTHHIPSQPGKVTHSVKLHFENPQTLKYTISNAKSVKSEDLC